MADAHAKNHDYHLVDPSPWPFVGAMILGLVLILIFPQIATFLPGLMGR